LGGIFGLVGIVKDHVWGWFRSSPFIILE
jgi:hypothetical protein